MSESVPLREHVEALRKAEERFQSERDRRYSDLRAADQRALQIKETADATALTLAAELQAEKDERRNEILGRWNDDRGTFITRGEYQLQHDSLETKLEAEIDTVSTRLEAQMKPLLDFLQQNIGGSAAGLRIRANTMGVLTLIVAIVGVAAYVIGAHFH